MADRYLPPSDFLRAIIEEVVPFGENDFDDLNLYRLMAMTRDANLANRDWATLLLAQLDSDRADVREALIAAASDADHKVRAEAILGLARLDRSIALPLLRKELAGEVATMPLFEAASLIADATLVKDLEAFAIPSKDAFLDKWALDALNACRATTP